MASYSHSDESWYRIQAKSLPVAVTRCYLLAHLAFSISYTTKMVVTRSSARSHDAPKGPTKSLATSRKGVNSSWRADVRATRQTRSDAAAGETRPQPPLLVKTTPPRRGLKNQEYASSIATHQARGSENEEEPEDGEEPWSDDEPQDDGESGAADGQGGVDRTKPLQHPFLGRLLMCFRSWSRPDI